MKKIILGLTLVLGVGVISANAQTAAAATAKPKTATTASAAAPAAMISVTEKDNTYDFGTVPQGTPVTHVFMVKNSGKAPLVLANVAPSCGCTTPEWSKEPIAPGASTPIKVTYNAATPGTFNKNINITSNASTPNAVLYIKGEVKAVEQAATGGPAAVKSATPVKN